MVKRNVLAATIVACVTTTATANGADKDLLPLMPEDWKMKKVVDYSEGHKDGLPKFEIGGRVLDLMNGEHFDDILRDTPDELRPPALVLFHSHLPPCNNADLTKNFQKQAERTLPSRERLFIAKYNVDAAPVRSWFRFTPEMDLESRFNVVGACPTLVFVPRKCSGWTEWCVQDGLHDGVQRVGCKNFKEQCTDFVQYKPAKDGEWLDWVSTMMKAEEEPSISPVFGSYHEQGQWLARRESTTTSTHRRNSLFVPAFPGFTPNGYKPMDIPKPLFDFLTDFYKRNLDKKKIESWDTSSTQLSFHETKTTFVDMDYERTQVNRMANKYLKPIVEEWTGLKNGLTLTSFYGIRAYPPGSWLRNHIDREDTHVISVTLSLGKLKEDGSLEPAQGAKWPLEFVDWQGEHVRYEHPAGTMTLYESAKGIHGRPYRNMGGWHLGAFCHFKPTANSGVKWTEISRRAKVRVAQMVQQVQYRSVPSVEPKHPKILDHSVGESTMGSNKPSRPSGGVDVTLHNKASSSHNVYWVPDDLEAQGLVFQGELGEGENTKIISYPGHRFYFTPTNDEDPALSIKTARPDQFLTVGSGRGKVQVLEYVPVETPTCDGDERTAYPPTTDDDKVVAPSASVE